VAILSAMARDRRRATPPAAPTASPLEALGIRPGQRVRFRRSAREHWTQAVAEGVEKDGSIGVRDGDGRFRAIPIERLEARVPGRRGGERWEPLADVAARQEQLGLF
jgi:hypothetical protein